MNYLNYNYLRYKMANSNSENDEHQLFYYKLNSWSDFLAIQCDKPSKLYSVRCNQKLLFTDPKHLRGDVWNTFIPVEFCEAKGKEYAKHLKMMEDIVPSWKLILGRDTGSASLCTYHFTC